MKHQFKKRLTAGILCAAMLGSTAAAYSPMTAAADAGDPNYGEALAMSLYFYDSNACGSGITGGPLTWRGDCHTYDGQGAASGVDGSIRQYVDPDGDGNVDLSGGYHDAGDHVKFNVTIGFALNGLALSEYLREGVYAKAGCKDHLIYVLRRGADYLMKTTFLDESGNVVAVAGTVGDGNTDHGIFTPPEEQTYARTVYWLTASKNNSAVCCEMAAGLAGTAYVVKDSDPAYAQKCIKYAKALEAFGTQHTGNNCDGMSFYSTDAQYQDEQAMCDTWLMLLGEGSGSSMQLTGNGAYTGGQYDGWKFTWDKTWQGYAAMMDKKTGEEVWKNELIYEMKNAGGLSTSSYNGNAGWGNSRYNCALQMDALTAAGDDKDSEYAKAAKYQMDYILGNNSYGYSFVVGYGSKWPTHIHHRAAAHLSEGQSLASNPESKFTPYGTMVGGPDNNGYEDHADKYQYTEPALDYNACFALAITGLYSLYGGDASAMKTVAQNASEINESFVFGDSQQTQETTTTETTTTTTTTTTSETTTTPQPGTRTPGDVDCSGDVNVADCVLLARFLAEDHDVTVTAQGKLNANVNTDSDVTSDDLTCILEYLAGMSDSL